MHIQKSKDLKCFEQFFSVVQGKPNASTGFDFFVRHLSVCPSWKALVHTNTTLYIRENIEYQIQNQLPTDKCAFFYPNNWLNV